MKLYSYIVTHDTGFAPNPFFGLCTLACCKPKIRKNAQVGDWVVGLSPRAAGNRLVYFMRVDERLPFDRFWADARFHLKRPRYNAEVVWKCGDNIYEPLPGDGYRQLRSAHSAGDEEDESKKQNDLSGEYVLISETFAYFGAEAQLMPDALTELIAQRGHKCHFPQAVLTAFRQYTEHLQLGVHAQPSSWPNSDRSWAELGKNGMDKQ